MKATRRNVKLGEIVNGNKVIGLTTTNGIISVYLMPMAAYPKFNFHVNINKQNILVANQYWATLVSSNGKIVFTGELRKNKAALIKTVKGMFSGVKIIDKTKK
jgi:uncharacterized protein YegP (UPF0339 family)